MTKSDFQEIISELEGRLNERLDKLESKFDEVDESIRGNGGRIGIRTKIAVLEARFRGVTGVVVLISGAVLVLLGKILFDWLSEG